MHKTVLLLWIYVLFTSCTTKPKEPKAKTPPDNNQPITITLPQQENGKCFISKIAKKIHYIPLETREETFFNPNNVSRLRIIKQDSILILSDTKKIMLFSSKGDFIRRIGKTGKGPSEYQRISNLTLQGDTISVSSTGTRSIKQYSTSGKFLNCINPKTQMPFFSNIPSGEYVWFNRTNGNIVYMDKNWQITDTLQVENKVRPDLRMKYSFSTLFGSYLFKCQERLLFTNFLSDTIWDITNKKKEPAIIIESNENKIAQATPTEITDNGIKNYEKQWKEAVQFNFVCGDSLILIHQNPNTYEKSRAAFFIFNKFTREITRHSRFRIHDDLHGNVTFRGFGIQNNKLFSFVDYEDIQKQFDKAEDEQTKQFWANLREKVNDINDNPVMVIIELK